MSWKRYFTVAAILTIVFGAGFAIAMTVLHADGSSVSKRNFERIHAGMAIQEVIKVLGKPDDWLNDPDSSLGRTPFDGPAGRVEEFPNWDGHTMWLRSDCLIMIRFEYSRV